MSYIVPQKMPLRCFECGHIFSSTMDGYSCKIAHRSLASEHGINVRRPDWCPLIEIHTPHGRLGDLDKLKYDIVVGNQKYLGLNAPCLEDVTPIENVDDCIDAIAFAPTVIEAEWRE